MDFSMTLCNDVEALKLDHKSLEAIERIRETTRAGKALSAAMTAGVFNSIFSKNSKPPITGYNITQTDWSLYGEAMNALPVIVRNRVRQEINLILVHYQMPGNYDHKHVQFWKGMKDGCK